MRDSQLRFIRQQGVTTPNPDRNLYEALMFQPRTIGCLVLLGVLLQQPWLFLILSAVLWWGTFVPTRNVFDALYNRLVALPRGRPRIVVAPRPRRFAQALAATLALAIGTTLLAQATVAAWILEGFFAAGVLAAVFADVCGPAQLYITATELLDKTGNRRLDRLV